MKAAIDAAEPGISSEFAGRPAVEAAIRDALGTTYLDLGEFSASIRQHERALSLRRELLGPDDPDTLTAMNNLAIAYQAAGRHERAVALHEEVLSRSLARRARDDPATLKAMSNLAVAYRRAGRPARPSPSWSDSPSGDPPPSARITQRPSSRGTTWPSPTRPAGGSPRRSRSSRGPWSGAGRRSAPTTPTP